MATPLRTAQNMNGRVLKGVHAKVNELINELINGLQKHSHRNSSSSSYHIEMVLFGRLPAVSIHEHQEPFWY